MADSNENDSKAPQAATGSESVAAAQPERVPCDDLPNIALRPTESLMARGEVWSVAPDFLRADQGEAGDEGEE